MPMPVIITYCTALLLIILLMMRLMASAFLTPPCTNPLHPFARHKRLSAPDAKTINRNRKPGWVKMEVLRLLALTRGEVGCRTVAALFNARFAYRGESIGKTYVAQLRKSARYAILQLRKTVRKPPRHGMPNQTWALDWTQVDVGIDQHTLLGVIDPGAILTILAQLIRRFGKPKSIRTDNDGAFVSIHFAIALRRLRIKHQRSPPHSPWANGTIERFFGTFKRAIRKIQIDSKAQLDQALGEFAFYYNHIRPHQNLGYRTPQMAWLNQNTFPKHKIPQWFAGSGGILCGWYWGEVKKPAKLTLKTQPNPRSARCPRIAVGLDGKTSDLTLHA